MSAALFGSEEELFAPVLRYLVDRRLVRPDTLIARHVRVNEKWIDLVTLTRSGALWAFELKLNHVTRALEQAAANTFSCDRSYVVSASRPGPTAMAQASALSVGLLVVSGNSIKTVVRAPKMVPLQEARRSLVGSVRSRGTLVADVSDR